MNLQKSIKNIKSTIQNHIKLCGSLSYFVILILLLTALISTNSIKLIANENPSINEYLDEKANLVTFTEPINLEILNTNADEFSPVFFDGNLYFNSDRNKFSQFFISNLNTDINTFSIPILLKSDINKLNESQSYLTFESNEKVYYSKFNNYNGKFYLNIFYSNFRKQNWNEGILVQSLSMPNFVSHPSISPNKDYMIFVVNTKEMSNKATFETTKSIDTDLMVSYKDNDGNWSDPELLEDLNTTSSEITPYITGSNGRDTLFFASNGYGGPGGYDLYYSIKSNGKWQRPNPINELNTEHNESDLCLFGNKIIFASDRPGGKGNLDLYISENKVQNLIVTKQTANLEVSLNSFLSSVKVKRTYEYNEQPIMRYVVIDKNSVEQNEEQVDEKNQNITQQNTINFLNQNINISSSNFKFNSTLFINELHYNSFIYPLLELHKTNNSELDEAEIVKFDNENLVLYLTIISNYDNNKLNTDNGIFINKYLGKLKSYLIENKLLKPENIQLNYIFNSNLKQDTAIIYLDYSNFNFLNNSNINDNNLLMNFELINEKDSVEIEPSLIGFEFQARPVNELNSWNTYILLKNKDLIYSSNNAPIEFQIDLSKYKDELKFRDSLTFYTVAKNIGNSEFVDVTNILVNQTKFKAKKLYNFSHSPNINNKLERINFYLPFFDELLLKKDLNLNSFLKNIETKNTELIIDFPINSVSYNKLTFTNYLRNNFPKIKYKFNDKSFLNTQINNNTNRFLMEYISFYFPNY